MTGSPRATPHRVVAALLAIYKCAVSPLLHALHGPFAGCRYQPSCSEYAALAWGLHGPWKGTRLALWRVLRCQPFCRGGFDPVPIPRTGTAEGQLR